VKSRSCRNSRDPCAELNDTSESATVFADGLTRTVGIDETVPLQPQVPPSKRGSVSLITSITLQALQLDRLRHREAGSSRCVDSWCVVGAVAVEHRRHDEVGICESQHRSCRYTRLPCDKHLEHR
jgi:hypothetical protein